MGKYLQEIVEHLKLRTLPEERLEKIAYEFSEKINEYNLTHIEVVQVVNYLANAILPYQLHRNSEAGTLSNFKIIPANKVH